MPTSKGVEFASRRTAPVADVTVEFSMVAAMPLLTRFQLKDAPMAVSLFVLSARPPDTDTSKALSTAFTSTEPPASTFESLMPASTVLLITLKANEPPTAVLAATLPPIATATILPSSIASTLT